MDLKKLVAPKDLQEAERAETQIRAAWADAIERKKDLERSRRTVVEGLDAGALTKHDKEFEEVQREIETFDAALRQLEPRREVFIAEQRIKTLKAAGSDYAQLEKAVSEFNETFARFRHNLELCGLPSGRRNPRAAIKARIYDRAPELQALDTEACERYQELQGRLVGILSRLPRNPSEVAAAAFANAHEKNRSRGVTI